MRDAATFTGDPLEIVRDDCSAVAATLSVADRDRLAGKSVLVTGAAGMLPSHVVDALCYLNDTGLVSRPVRLLLVVRSVDANEGRLAHLAGRRDVRFIVADAVAPYYVEEPIHFAIHAASPASPAAYRADPVGTLDASSAALRHVLELARRDHAESVLYVSSSEVYGSPGAEHVPTPETYVGRTPFLGGRACYVEAKRFGEALCAAYAEQYRVPVKIVRPFHVHGPGLRLGDSRIVAALISMGIRGEPFALKSDGRATRTYGYISDATTAFLKALLSEEDGEAFNVGASEPETSMVELATIVARLFGRDEPVAIGTDPAASHLAGAPDRVRPDLTKLRERLGVAPMVSLEDGLARTIRWHQLRAGARGGGRGTRERARGGLPARAEALRVASSASRGGPPPKDKIALQGTTAGIVAPRSASSRRTPTYLVLPAGRPPEAGEWRPITPNHE